MKKIPNKFGCYDRFNVIKHDLKEIVYESMSVDEFETKWRGLIETCNLKENDWLSGLFEEPQRWLPIYFKRYLWADMSTIHRSESITSTPKLV
jgi:hypothetical protein